MDWYENTYDCQRIHSDEELKELLRFTLEQILEWLEGVMIFVWEAKK
ncbi:MAG: hypothetical protein IT392_00660 [Nitrospirae bacterium]|nr:hypothetical protein [Nitrospirota bacterium]